MFTKCTWIWLCLIDFIHSEMEPFIVGGDFASTLHFPHSAFIGISCVKRNTDEYYWICGGSIVNQDIILTAAHCFAGCGPRSHMAVTVGHEHKQNGIMSSAVSYVIHADYTPEQTSHDIALMKLKTRLSFSLKVRRVALMKDPPYNEKATVAGWGIIDEEKQLSTNLLKYIEQVVWPNDECKLRIRRKPQGTICASNKMNVDFASRGDSGSALLVRGYIQIGIVSYKVPHVANNLIIYTDVGYYYDWIDVNTKLLYCSGKKTEI